MRTLTLATKLTCLLAVRLVLMIAIFAPASALCFISFEADDENGLIITALIWLVACVAFVETASATQRLIFKEKR